MSIKINNQNIVALYKGEQSIAYVYKGTDLVWQNDLDKYIYFVDPEVGRVLKYYGLIADATRATKRELAAIKKLRSSNSNTSHFYRNQVITQFPELKYFTGLTDLDSTFMACSNLTTVVIPNGVTRLDSTFYGCKSLTEPPVIPEGVTDMYQTFYDCSSLTTAPVIPQGVIDLTNTFSGCSSLTTAPVIPSSVTNLTNTFWDCSRLTTAPVIPSSVTNLSGTFYMCSSLTEPPVIPEGVTNLFYTFMYCSSLTTPPVLPSSVTNLKYAFTHCSGLRYPPEIPSGVTDLFNAFHDCSRISGIYFINIVTPIDYSNSLFNVQAIYVPDASVDVYKQRKGWRDFADRIYPIGEGWDGIFADPEVGRVLHANGLIADANKSSIKELATIKSLNPANTGIGSYFYDNKVITQFPELKYCTGLRSLYGAFNGCSNLTTVGDIPHRVTNMNSTFYGCSSLTTAPIIPSSVTDLNSTFSACTSLTTAPVIPEGVTDLSFAFEGCSSLTTAPVLPSSVTKLYDTFRGCSSIDGIYIINAVTPPSMYYDNNLSNVQAIYVPNDSVGTYKTNYVWSSYADKIYPMLSKP